MRLIRARRALVLAALFAGATGAQAGRTPIAVFRDWGAFREAGSDGDVPTRCFAIAEPAEGTRSYDTGAFAAVASWPHRRLRAQVSLHLSHAPRANAPVTLTIGDASFALAARDRNAWTGGRRQDALIVAAMRSGSSMSVASVAPDGTPFADVYRLRGAASAIDAALLACPMR